jgi:hypothetical protein
MVPATQEAEIGGSVFSQICLHQPGKKHKNLSEKQSIKAKELRT